MPLKFCANLSYLFTEVPVLDRFEAAARAGFMGVEMLAPYDQPANALRERLDGAGLRLVLINSYAGNRAAGERGMACIPGRQAEFRDSIERTLDYAVTLGCKLVHFMAGLKPDDVAQETAAALYAVNLHWAAERAARAGVRLAIEAINGRDMPTYFLKTQEQAAAIVRAIGSDKVGLQFDIYHCQTMQGDVARRLEALLPIIAHIQVADVPGRHEPGTGEVGWKFLFEHIQALGYQGWIGCEYTPATNTIDSLQWRQSFAPT